MSAVLISRNEQIEQMIAAAKTVNNKTSRRRRLFIAGNLQRLAKDRDANIAAIVYYLSLGTVPESLWSE